MTIPRASIEARVLASLDAGRIPVLLGGCGTGRTTLLRRIAAARPGAGRYVDLAAVATTPERCVLTVSGAAMPRGLPASAAFARLLDHFDLAPTAPGTGRRVWLLDEFQELRTFENFPGLRHVQRDFIARLAASPNGFVLASRFTARAHRLLREAPARFEVIHLAPLDAADVDALARERDGRADWAHAVAGPVQAISAGRILYATALLDAMTGAATSEAETALAELFSPEGRLTALCRFSYEFRLHRARGYGALKAILGILADEEPLTLTDIAQRLHRTPGSTKDYLSWLEDVDVLTVSRKKYTFDDPLVRLYVRLYTGAEPPSRETILSETRRFAAERLAAPRPASPGPGPATDRGATGPGRSAEPELVASDTPSRDSGIIEID